MAARRLRLFVPGLLATVLLIFATPGRAAPDYLVQVWQTDNGLPENWISSIAQTGDGYLWIGTRYGGLARFDGVRFVRFTPQNTPGLQDTQVERLSVDEEGTMWIAMGERSVSSLHEGQFSLMRRSRTNPQSRLETRLEAVLSVAPDRMLFVAESGEIAAMDRAKGADGWSVFKPTPAPLAFNYNIYPAETFRRDRDGRVWYIDQDHHLARVAIDGQEDGVRPPLRPAQVNALAIDPQGILWIATDRQIASWDGHTLEDHTPANVRTLAGVRQIAFSGDHTLWLLGRRRLQKLSNGVWSVAADSTALQASLASRHYNLYGDSQGGAWIVSYGHGLLHARADGTTRQLTEADGLPSNLITAWFEDKKGNVWLGTAGGGIARIRERIFQALGPADGLPEKVVRSVGVDRAGILWAGTMSGQLASWSEGKFSVLPLPPVDPTPLSGITVWPSRAGGVWIGSLYHGLIKLDHGQITRPVSMGGESWFIRILFEDSKNGLWVGGQDGLRRYVDGQVTSFGASEGFPAGIAIGSIDEAPDGTIWVGTGPGNLWQFHNNRFTCFQPPAEWPHSRFIALQADADGVVWVGTLGNGLLRFQNGQFTRFTTQEGLPDDNVTQLLADHEGNLWGGTYAGIFRVKKTALHDYAAGRATKPVFSTYGIQDGLPALECTGGFSPACWRAEDGRLWFSTVNGIVSVNPSTVLTNQSPPGVLIEEMLVDGKPHDLPQSAAQRSPGRNLPPALEVGPGRHYIQFRFTGLNFIAPDSVRFRVRLEGSESEWQNVGGQRIIGYGPLPPGDYHFRVAACNNDGVWNEQGDTLVFRILPYFWETPWFKAGLAAAVLTSLGLIVALAQRRRYRRRLHDIERQRELEHERARIARDLHDDLGTSLTQISMLSALANRDQTAPDEAREIINQMHGRAREMVTALDEIVWAVNPKNDSWAELANYLAHFAEEFFRSTPIRCRFDIPDQLPSSPPSAELRHHLFLAFKEALNNAARHSGATRVCVRLETGPTEIVIAIEDDGRGFTPQSGTHHRQGNGLANMKKRLEEVGGSAEVGPAPRGGITVAFRVPLR